MFRRCKFWVGRSIRLPAEERRVLAARDNMVQGLLKGCLRQLDYPEDYEITCCCCGAFDRQSVAAVGC